MALSTRMFDTDSGGQAKEEDIIVPSKISIDENVSFSHKQHVGHEEASDFLVRLLKLREERFMEIHQNIRENITRGYMYLRPPAHMSEDFTRVAPKEQSSFRRRRTKSKSVKNNSGTKPSKFWFELTPQPISRDSEQFLVSPFRPPGERKESVFERRYDMIKYFPSNLENSAERLKADIPNSKQLPKGAPDYVLYAYSSELKNDPSQVLIVIPLGDVKITPISPTEFSISYVNTLPNTHIFRAPSPELAQTWLKTFELATQQDIQNPFSNISSPRRRNYSFSHSISVFRDSIGGRSPKNESNRHEERQKKKEEEDSLPYYKPICWDSKELLTEGGGAFSSKLQWQEVFVREGSDSVFGSVRQGWRILGGTFDDILTWCILTSERNDKPNIDVSSFIIMSELSVDCILQKLEHIWQLLKARLMPQTSKKRRTGFFRSVNGVSVDFSQSVEEEHISLVVNLERRLVNFTTQWICILLQLHPNENTLNQVQPIIEFIRSHCGPEKVKLITTMLEETSKSIFKNENGSNDLFNGEIPCPIISELVPPGESVMVVSSDILAQQLTVLEIEYFEKLKLSEFLNLAWDKTPEKAPGIRSLINHYNSTGLWVATEILMAATPKLQAKMVGKFLHIAQKLFELRNYATCAQILSGVSNRAIQRLKRVHKQLDWKAAERYQTLNEHFDPVSGYANYRNKLDHSPPSIPFLAVNLRTLTLIEEGNPTTLGNDPEVMSFARMVMYTECIATMQLGNPLQTDYNFESIPEVQNHLKNVPIMNEDKLYDISVQFEPLRGGLAK